MKPVSRVYPIRRTAGAWKIRMLAPHVCNKNFACDHAHVKITESDGSVRYIPVENPKYKDEKCPDFGKLIPVDVPLKNFDVDYPCTHDKIPLYNPNEIVIPDTRFNVIISYPIRNPTQITMFAPSENGFTLAELISSLKSIYEFIYLEEERTATPTIYECSEKCPDCSDKNLSSFLKNTKLVDLCAICYSNARKRGCVLPCDHKFHFDCVMPWIKKHNTCPLCRRYIKKCSTCAGSGLVFQERSDVVIPIEYRGFPINRNSTDGVFGIWGHDLEDLILEDLLYDHSKKLLHISIGS